jgi:hypothetical protein
MDNEQQSTNAATPAAQPTQGDISSKTITVLVLLTLVFAFVGAWVNIELASTTIAKPTTTYKAPPTGEVAFTIKQPDMNVATGRVLLDIQKAPE